MENKKQKKKRKAEAVEYEMNLSRQSSTDFLYDRKENDNLLEEEYCLQPEIHEKYQFNSTTDNDSDMSYEYQHVWNGPWSVWEEYYIAMHRVKSELHMSDNQVEGSICICANILFANTLGCNKFGKWNNTLHWQ